MGTINITSLQYNGLRNYGSVVKIKTLMRIIEANQLHKECVDIYLFLLTWRNLNPYVYFSKSNSQYYLNIAGYENLR